MNARYYVQEIANNYLKNVADPPSVLSVHPSFLRGTEPEAFADGFRALHAFVTGLISDIATDPAAFGMLLKENAEPDAKNTDYTNSNASFVRILNLLLILGLKGTPGPGGTLIYDGQALAASAKELKVTALVFLLNKLTEYGFVIEGLGKTVKPGDSLTLSYPDVPALTAALKSIAEAQLAANKGYIKQSKNYFYMLHSGLLAHEKVKPPKLTIDDLLRTLDDNQRAAARALHGFTVAEAKYTADMGGFMRNDWSCAYTSNKTKRILMTLSINQDRLSVKLNLQHVGQYIDRIRQLPAALLDRMREYGWDCGFCRDKCAGGYAFELDGQAYNKCRCGSFVFDDMTAEIVPHYIQMLQYELELA